MYNNCAMKYTITAAVVMRNETQKMEDSSKPKGPWFFVTGKTKFILNYV